MTDAAGPHAGKGPRTWTLSDSQLREEVSERLMDDRLIDARGDADGGPRQLQRPGDQSDHGVGRALAGRGADPQLQDWPPGRVERPAVHRIAPAPRRDADGQPMRL